jgi:hypothetical protein
MTIAKRMKGVPFKKIKKSESTKNNKTRKSLLNDAKKNSNTADTMKKIIQDLEDEFLINVSIINNITE